MRGFERGWGGWRGCSPSWRQHMECGNDSYRFDCFCSCSNPWLVPISPGGTSEGLDLLALQDEQSSKSGNCRYRTP
jgi:hypothetical protein